MNKSIGRSVFYMITGRLLLYVAVKGNKMGLCFLCANMLLHDKIKNVLILDDIESYKVNEHMAGLYAKLQNNRIVWLKTGNLKYISCIPALDR